MKAHRLATLIATFLCTALPVQAGEVPLGAPHIVFERTDLSYAAVANIGAAANSGGGEGTLTLDGAEGDITLSLLYWHGIDIEDPGNGFTGGNANYDQATIQFNGQSITGTAIGTKGYNNNWGGSATPDKFSGAAFRADVTHLVHGPGSYTISGLADGAGHSASGASLIVFHDDGIEHNDVRVAHHEAMDSNCAPAQDEHWNARLWLDYTGGRAELILHAADGQTSLADGDYRIRVFPGILPNESGEIVFRDPHTDGKPLWGGQSVPRMTSPRPFSGQGLWDVRRFDITPTLHKPGRYYLYGRDTFDMDCITLLAMQVVNSAPGMPPAITPAEHDFGDVLPDVASSTQLFTFANRQNAPITVGAVTSGPAVFTISSNTCTGVVLEPGATCTVAMHCTPSSARQDHQGTLRINWTDAFGKAWDSRGLTYCSGVSEAPHGRLTIDPPNVWFGVVSWGSHSSAIRFTATSTGTVPVTLQSPRFFGTHAGSFRIAYDGCLGLTLAPGEQCVLDVQFRPTPGSGLLVRQATMEFNFTASAPLHLPRPILIAGTVVVDNSGIFKNGFEID
ncbi:choice-of-anchor D domain-containing protein [Xanthomonadaceae bacterium JHOS43]|nr:choice-of-anchor D domain-containing protein [Xanthomonadaceae bacterium JHOS43]